MCPMNPVPDLVGKTRGEAEKIAKKSSYEIRIAKLNGKICETPFGFCAGRINVELEGIDRDSAVIVKQDIG